MREVFEPSGNPQYSSERMPRNMRIPYVENFARMDAEVKAALTIARLQWFLPAFEYNGVLTVEPVGSGCAVSAWEQE